MNQEEAIDASHRKHVTRKLRLMVRIYFVISVILVAVVVFDIVRDDINIFFPILAGLIGIGIGLIVARIYHISWDHGAKKVISRFDEIGAFILTLYVFFELFKEQLINHYVHGPAVLATSISLLTGIMIGRVYGISGKITRILKEQNKPNDQFSLLH